MWAQIAIAAVQTITAVVSATQQAKAAKQEGKVAMDQANAKANQVEREGARIQGSQFAEAGGAGIVPVSGSPIEIMMETAFETEIRKNDELYQGKIGKWYAKRKANQAWVDAFGSILSAGGKVAGAVDKAYPSGGNTNSGVMGQSVERTSWASSASGRYSLR
jgi:hypothetical protein